MCSVLLVRAFEREKDLFGKEISAERTDTTINRAVWRVEVGRLLDYLNLYIGALYARACQLTIQGSRGYAQAGAKEQVHFWRIV